MKQAHDEILEKWLDEQITLRRWLVNPNGKKWEDGYQSGLLDGTMIVRNKLEELMEREMTIGPGDMYLYAQAQQEKRMTREEALKVVKNSNNGICSGWFVDALEKLGLLKLEEPKSVRDQAGDILIKEGYSNHYITILERAGFKIVKA